MPLILRLFLIFVGLLALFWLLAMVVGWLWYVVVALGVVAVIGVLIRLFTQKTGSTATNASQTLTRKHEKKAEKELKTLEQRQKNRQP